MTGDARALEACISAGGVAVFPSDTVYGLACDPENESAVRRLYALKHRPLDKPSAVMFFARAPALALLGPRTATAARRLLPGGVSLLVPNPGRRFLLACGEDPGTLGLRVPEVPGLREVERPVLQSSANLAGGPDPRRVADIPEEILGAVDLVIDGGELPGTPSTVVDLRAYEETGAWSVVRRGAVGEETLTVALSPQLHFDPAIYGEVIRDDLPDYDAFQARVAEATGTGAQRILELGTGTGETARRVLDRHQGATLVGIDESDSMLGHARETLPGDRVELHVARLQDPLPLGPFDLVVSALCVHHLDADEKADLFRRVRAVLAPGGRFVLGDVVVPDDPADAVSPLTPCYDQPSTLAEQLDWLRAAGLEPRVVWRERDLAVVVG